LSDQELLGMMRMCKMLIGGVAALAAITLAPLANADPTVGHDAKVRTQVPQMLCVIGSDDTSEMIGANVVCQRGEGFAQTTSDKDQACINSKGWFGYRAANIGVGGSHDPFPTLDTGQTYDIQGWMVVAGSDDTRFTNEGTGHGMAIGRDTTVKTF
jgi:hypothetical protein